RVYGGTGLGLVISKNFVQLMGGAISVTSRTNEGTCFRFNIVLAVPEISLIDSSIPAEQSLSLLSGKVALVVDDNEFHRNALQAQLTYWGVQTDITESADGAFRLLETKKQASTIYDFVLVDSSIFGGTGDDLVVSLSERFPSLRSILLVGLEDSVSNDSAYKPSNCFTTTKPISYLMLYHTIGEMLFGETYAKQCVNDDVAKIVAPKILTHRNTAARILVAEDNRINQIVVKGILDTAGMDIEFVDNGQDAFERATDPTSCFDLVLMDCQMPKTDGYEATLLIRNWEREQGHKRIPIIALTANATKEDVEKCFSAGMDAYCSKPIDAAKVIAEIHKWLEMKQSAIK
ncbi:MAG: response regulator, partial [Thermoguttaceae bacterium]